MSTDIAEVAVPKASSTPTRTATTAPATTPPASSSAAGVISAPAGSTVSPDHSGLWMLLAALVLVGAIGALLYQRYAPKGLLAGLVARSPFRGSARKQ